MALVTASIDIFLLSSILATLPWLYFTFHLHHPRRNAQNVKNGQAQAESHSGRRRLLSIFIALHTVYILYKLIVLGSQNLFTLLHIPLNQSSEEIRQLLLQKAGVALLPRSLEVVLTRLQSFDVRMAYFRFGHSVVQDCEHCTSFDDFALYALPRPVLEYVRMAAVIGLVTVQGSGCERWRFWALGVLAVSWIAELYFVLTTEMTFSAERMQTLMPHDTALRLRRIFFLVLPPLLYVAPSRRLPPSLLQALPEVVARAERTRARLQLLRLTSAARARHPSLRAPADAWWAAQRADGQCAISDPALREMAEKLGMGLDSDDSAGERKGLRSQVRTAVELLQNGFRPRN